MPFTVEDIKTLRDKTGAGMMACKEALAASGGSIEAAVEYLRKKGVATAEKKAGRATGDGAVESAISPDRKSGAIIELNCETDFVAKTDQFKALAASLAGWALMEPDGEIPADRLPENRLAEIKEAIAKMGENIKFRRGSKLTASKGVVESYIHLGGKMGVLIKVDGEDGPELRALAKELAMQVAAASPLYVTKDQVPAEALEKEKDIYREQVRGSGKPEKVVENIVAGKIKKYYSEVCLMDQAYIKDPAKTVETAAKEIYRGPLGQVQFVRFRLGE
jgi:elongation factor Ts